MSTNTILVAEDDVSVRTVVGEALGRAGYDVRASAHAAGLWENVAAGEGDLVISDVILPDENIFDLLPRITHMRPALPVIVMSARNTFKTALRALQLGAYEYMPKPVDLDQLVQVVDRALRVKKPTLSAPQWDVLEDLPLVGRSSAMQEIYRAIGRLVHTDLSVMIVGESGTGKELVARALHDHSKRASGPFVAVNMAALPRDLIEAELFGHERGAFTGADRRMPGRFEQADGGTLFLDEIGDMPVEAQTRLLRVLQEGEFSRIGGRTLERTNVRIISATHRNLSHLITQGRFREDLFYRLNVMPVKVPALRERREDIADLIFHFVRQMTGAGHSGKTFTGEALEALRQHHWPGNVRELENLVKRITVLQPEETITADIVNTYLAEHSRDNGNQGREASRTMSPPMGISDAVAHHMRIHFAQPKVAEETGLYEALLPAFERPLLQATLAATGGNQVKAAAILGMNRNTLRKKIRKLGISVSRQMR